MFGTTDPRPRIAFLGSFGGLRPFGAELANTAFGLACQQMKQAGTLTNEQSSESAAWGWTGDSTYQQNTTNIGRKPVEITAGRSGSALSQVHQNNQQQHQQVQHDCRPRLQRRRLIGRAGKGAPRCPVEGQARGEGVAELFR